MEGPAESSSSITPGNIHWLAPASMLGAWIAGALFAAGHHLFYQYLDGKPASAAGFYLMGSSISDQEVNTAIGTAFAYVVKAFLVFAMSTAFVQVFWKEAMARNAAPRTLAKLDATFSAFYNVHALFNVPVWFRFPVLLALAGTAW